MVYSICSSLVTKIITVLIDSILYDDVVKLEAQKREKAMSLLHCLYVQNDKVKYRKQLRKGFLILRIIINLKHLALRKHKIILLTSDYSVTDKSSLRLLNSNDNQSLLQKDAISNLIKDSSKDQSFILTNHDTKRNSFFRNSFDVKHDDANIKSKIPFQSCLNDVLSPHHTMDISDVNFIEIDKTSKLRIQSKITINLLSDKNTIKKTYYNKVDMGVRQFTFPLEDPHIQCFYISFSKKFFSFQNNKINWLRGEIKFIILLALMLVLWLYMLIFIVSIFSNYEENFYKIVVAPMIAIMFTKFIVTMNINILIATFFMHNLGLKFYTNKKKSILGIIFNIFVSPIAASLHQSILNFRLICEALQYK